MGTSSEQKFDDTGDWFSIHSSAQARYCYSHAACSEGPCQRVYSDRGGVYSSGFYTLLGRYAVLQDAAYARTFVKDQDEKLENMHDKLRAKWADNALGDAYDITQCVEFTDLVEQTLLDSYVYIAVLTDEERLLFCLNVLVNFEDGIPIQNDKESIDLYHAWLCTDRLKLPPCTMPLLKERRD